MANGGGGQTPQITSISPSVGPATGGTQVRLVGSGFNGASKVTFGGVPAKVFQVNSDTEILATTDVTPAGDAPVVVTTPAGTNAGPGPVFTMVPPPLIVDAHLEGRGDSVVIHGTDLTGVLSVSFVQTINPDDDPDAPPAHDVRTPAESVRRHSDGSLHVRRPPGPAGPANVVVTTSGGDSPPYAVYFPVHDSRRWIFWLSTLYLLMLLGGMVAYLQWDGFRNGLPVQLGPVPLAVAWFGALGSVFLSMYGVLWHRIDWDPTFTLWHVVRPLMGVVLGMIAYLILAGGIVASGGQPSGTANTAPSPTPSASAASSTSTSSTSASSTPATTPTPLATSTSTASGTTTTTTTTTTTSTSGGTTNPANPFNNVFYDVVAFLVGFRESTFRRLIQKLADLVVGPGASSSGSSGGSSGSSGGSSGTAAAGSGSASA